MVSYVRGGFFTALGETERQAAIDDNRRVIDEAEALGAPLIVLVPGATPGIPLGEARNQIADGLAAITAHAEAAGVRLGIEPLHPVYADTRSAVNTLAQANDLAEALDSPTVGVVVDVYHLWWDPDLEAEVARCGQGGNLFAFHVCDWKSPTGAPSPGPRPDGGRVHSRCARSAAGWRPPASPGSSRSRSFPKPTGRWTRASTWT